MKEEYVTMTPAEIAKKLMPAPPSPRKEPTMADLLPCPFCGLPVTEKTEGNLTLLVCGDGSCRGSGLWSGFLVSDRPHATAAWNRRAVPAVTPAPTLAEAVAKEREECANLAASEAESRLRKQVSMGSEGLHGIGLMHGQVSEAMKKLASAIRARGNSND